MVNFRYYYNTKILLPVKNHRLVYKFGPNARGWNNGGTYGSSGSWSGPSAGTGSEDDEEPDTDDFPPTMAITTTHSLPLYFPTTEPFHPLLSQSLTQSRPQITATKNTVHFPQVPPQQTFKIRFFIVIWLRTGYFGIEFCKIFSFLQYNIETVIRAQSTMRQS